MLLGLGSAALIGVDALTADATLEYGRDAGVGGLRGVGPRRGRRHVDRRLRGKRCGHWSLKGGDFD